MKPIALRPLARADVRPFYRQVAAILRDAIADRTYAAGERIPSVRDLATHFGVTALTIGAGLKELVNEGLITSRKGFGFYVLTNNVERESTGRAASPLDRKLRRLLHHLGRLPGIPLAKLPALLTEIAEVAREIEDDLQPPEDRRT